MSTKSLRHLWMWGRQSPEYKCPAEARNGSFFSLGVFQSAENQGRGETHEGGMVFQAADPEEHKSGIVGYAEKTPQHL